MDVIEITQFLFLILGKKNPTSLVCAQTRIALLCRIVACMKHHFLFPFAGHLWYSGRALDCWLTSRAVDLTLGE